VLGDPNRWAVRNHREADGSWLRFGSGYISVFNDYVSKGLKFGDNKIFEPEIEIWKIWTL
jgi:hypothetical protein